MQVREMPPQQIDEMLADLHADLFKAEEGVDAAIAGLHHALGERRLRRAGWPTTTAQAIVKLVNIVADEAYEEPAPYSWQQSPAKALEKLDTARARVWQIREAMAPFNAEFDRRGGWPRYYTVRGGHIHSSMNCKTCHRNGKPTDMGWTPQLSGRTVDQAMAELGPQSFVLCTVCFPGAPLEWTVKQEKPSCPGSRQAPVAKTARRVGMNTYAECTGCGERHRTNQMGYVVKHSPKKQGQAA